jgi:HlyD family secretion protein
VEFIKRHWIIAALTAAILLAVGLFGAFSTRGDNKSQFFTAKVEHGDIREVVEATGTINAVITVQVGSQVSGTIAKLNADFNSRVKKGQVVAQIDPALFQGTLLQNKSDLANAQANLTAAKANLEKAQATASQAKADYERNKALGAEGVVSPQQLDLARANADTAVAGVSAAAAQIVQAEAQVKQKEAAVEVAQTNLNYTIIHAPIDGTVIARNVDVGQTVAASLQAPTLFTIAQDLTKMQVYANTDESDVGTIRPGQIVTFKVDAFPKDTFTGRVDQIRMNATVVQNVVTYNTVINFDNPDLKLFPGMTAYVTIPVASATKVLKIPNGSLRFKPDMKADEIRALYAKYGIEDRGAARAAAADHSGGGVVGAGDRQARATGEGNAGGGAAPQGNTQAQTRGPRMDVAIVWKLRPDKTLEPVRVRTGITDHTVTEVVQVLNGQLNDEDDVITGAMTSSGNKPPSMGGPAMRR